MPGLIKKVFGGQGDYRREKEREITVKAVNIKTRFDALQFVASGLKGNHLKQSPFSLYFIVKSLEVA